MSEHPRVELWQGVTYRQLDHWVRKGLIFVNNGATPGSGHARWYSVDELAIARRIGELRLEGYELEPAARKARAEHRPGWQPCGTGWPG